MSHERLHLHGSDDSELHLTQSAKGPAAEEEEEARERRRREKKREKRLSREKVTAATADVDGSSGLGRDGAVAYPAGYERAKLRSSAAAVHPHSPAPRPLDAAPTTSMPSHGRQVQAPTPVDFSSLPPLPAFVAAPLSSLAGRAAASGLVFTVLRLYTSYLSSLPSAVDHHTALALFLSLSLISVLMLVSPSFHPPPPSLSPSSLSFHLHSYLRAWELVAADDFAQLSAAYAQVQQLTGALLFSLRSHATAVLHFLDAAHGQLHLEQGYSPLLQQLLAHSDALRAALPGSEAPPPLSRQPHAVLALAAVGAALFAYVLLPLHSLSFSPASLCHHLLLPLAVCVLVTSLLLSRLEEQRKARERVEEVRLLQTLREDIDGRVVRHTQAQAQAQAGGK